MPSHNDNPTLTEAVYHNMLLCLRKPTDSAAGLNDNFCIEADILGIPTVHETLSGLS